MMTVDEKKALLEEAVTQMNTNYVNVMRITQSILNGNLKSTDTLKSNSSNIETEISKEIDGKKDDLYFIMVSRILRSIILSEQEMHLEAASEIILCLKKYIYCMKGKYHVLDLDMESYFRLLEEIHLAISALNEEEVDDIHMAIRRPRFDRYSSDSNNEQTEKEKEMEVEFDTHKYFIYGWILLSVELEHFRNRILLSFNNNNNRINKKEKVKNNSDLYTLLGITTESHISNNNETPIQYPNMIDTQMISTSLRDLIRRTAEVSLAIDEYNIRHNNSSSDFISLSIPNESSHSVDQNINIPSDNNVKGIEISCDINNSWRSVDNKNNNNNFKLSHPFHLNLKLADRSDRSNINVLSRERRSSLPHLSSLAGYNGNNFTMDDSEYSDEDSCDKECDPYYIPIIKSENQTKEEIDDIPLTDKWRGYIKKVEGCRHGELTPAWSHWRAFKDISGKYQKIRGQEQREIDSYIRYSSLPLLFPTSMNKHEKRLYVSRLPAQESTKKPLANTSVLVKLLASSIRKNISELSYQRSRLNKSRLEFHRNTVTTQFIKKMNNSKEKK